MGKIVPVFFPQGEQFVAPRSPRKMNGVESLHPNLLGLHPFFGVVLVAGNQFEQAVETRAG
ncbi:MAG: hypothetical protein ACFUZC_04805 [Chthoniobacteraceae bacterium]